MIKTKGILHVTIPVSNLARSRAFYTDILGLEFVAEVPKENPHFVFLKSGADYVILGRDTSSGRFSDIIHHAFMVEAAASSTSSGYPLIEPCTGETPSLSSIIFPVIALMTAWAAGTPTSPSESG